MINKNEVPRIIELWDGENWQYSCMLYKPEMIAFLRLLTQQKGATKVRYRLLGVDSWHISYSSNF